MCHPKRHRPLSKLVLFAWMASVPACSSSGREGAHSALDTMRAERDPAKLLQQGEACDAMGDPSRAAQYYRAALEEGADEKRVMPRLIDTLIRDKQYRAAIDQGERYLRRHPGDQPLRFVLATLYSVLGETQTARDRLEQVVAKEPKNAEAHYALAVLLRDEQADQQGATTHFRNYIQLLPDGVHVEEAKSSLLKETTP